MKLDRVRNSEGCPRQNQGCRPTLRAHSSGRVGSRPPIADVNLSVSLICMAEPRHMVATLSLSSAVSHLSGARLRNRGCCVVQSLEHKVLLTEAALEQVAGVC